MLSSRVFESCNGLAMLVSTMLSKLAPFRFLTPCLDFICNWVGNYGVTQAITFDGQTEYRAKALAAYTVDGVEMGQFKTVDNLSFLRVYKAGHEVPYYRKLIIPLPPCS
jgi:carboxypeptidase C (cathepsin A)